MRYRGPNQGRSRRGPKPLAFRPKWSSPCLCGSGRKYNSCCRRRLPGFDIGKRSREAIKSEKLSRALIDCRADITQYTIWHKSHTEPAMRTGNPAIAYLLKTDIGALAHLVDLLCQLHLKTGQQAKLSAVLERLRNNIGDGRWQRKISYFHTLNSLWPKWDRDAGRKEFEKLGEITPDEDDLEILQLYIDLYADEISFSTRIKLFDQVLALSDAISDRLQYQGAKAMEYLLVGDAKGAEHELVDAIEFSKKEGPIDELAMYGRLKLSNCLEMLAFIRRDQGLFQEAIDLLKGLLEEDGFTDEGRADLYRQLGDCHRYAGAWNDAESAYRNAVAIMSAPICEIFLSEILLRQDKINDATRLIDSVKSKKLDAREYEDFVFTFAAIAMEAGEASRLEEAKNLLENLNIATPYFSNRRLELIVNVQATMESGRSVSIIEATREMLAGMARSAGRYLILKPSFMGLGLNINSIIDDLAKEKHAKPIPGDEGTITKNTEH